MPSWAQVEQTLTDEGYTNSDIVVARDGLRDQLSNDGYGTPEIERYFGIKRPNLSPVKKHIESNFAKITPIKQVEGEPIEKPGGPPPREATTILDAIEAGWDMSVTGLLTKQENPDVVLTENSPMHHRLLSTASTLVGDIPAMVAGAFAGTVAGGAVGTAVAPGPGTLIGAAVGAGAGTFALPSGMRKLLMDYYEKGEVQDFGDFWERTSGVFIEAGKGAVIGGATAGVGVLFGKFVPALFKGAPKIVQGVANTAAQTSAEVATLVSVGSAIEGHAPKAVDFLEAGILIGGLKGSVKIATKLRTIYSKTGKNPTELALEAEQDPALKGELASDNIELPEVFGPPEKINIVKVPEKLNENPEIFIETKETIQLKVPDKKPEIPKEEVVKKPAKTPENDVLDQIDFDGVKPKLEFDGDAVYTKYIDDLHPLRQLVKVIEGKGEKIAFADDPYILARLTRGDFGRADQVIENGPFNFNTKKTVGKGIREILEPIKTDIESFEAYAVASRAVELEARKIKSGIPIESAKEVVKSGAKKFQKPFEELVEYQDNVLTYLKDSGILSNKAFKTIKEANKSYVPFFRVMDPKSTSGAGKGLTVRNPIKKIKGSDRVIVSPLESIIKNTYLYVKLAERNRMLTKLVELGEKHPAASELIQRVPTKLRPIKIAEKEVKKFFDEHGIEADPEIMTIFRPQKKTLAPDEVAVYKDGKRRVYKVPDEVAETINGMDEKTVGLLMKFLAAPAKALRAGVTLVPEFSARNFIRDQSSATIFSSSGYVPVWEALKGVGELFKASKIGQKLNLSSKIYQDFLKSGGANSAIVSLDRNYIKEKVFNISSKTGLIDKTWNVVKSPFQMARVVSELIENSSRLGEFKKARAKGVSLEEAGFRAREVTLDFARMGTNIRAANMITAFLNVGIQGMDRTARAFKDAPLRTTAKIGASITLPSVMLWAVNHTDERWREIPRWQKDLFWIIMTKDHVYRIPKPFELGILFGSLPERVLETFFTDNPRALKDFMASVIEGATPSLIPTIAVPIIEQFANRSTFTGRPIIPWETERLLPEYQYAPYTSETAKGIGSLIASVPGLKQSQAASPALIQNYIRAWTGGLGQYMLKLADEALIISGVIPDPVKPTSALSDIPIIKAFVIRHPSATSQSIQDFYDRFAEKQKVQDTIKFLAAQGDLDNVQKELALEENQDKLVNLQGVKSSLSNLNKMVHIVNKNKDFKPEEKRQMIDGLYFNMIEISKFGNKIMDDLDKNLKENK